MYSLLSFFIILLIIIIILLYYMDIKVKNKQNKNLNIS